MDHRDILSEMEKRKKRDEKSKTKHKNIRMKLFM